MQLHFLRHAESVSNAKLKEQFGKGDQLSPLGLTQALELSKKLDRNGYDSIYVSPSLRTIQTILPYLLKTGQRAKILPSCMEIPSAKTSELDLDVFTDALSAEPHTRPSKSTSIPAEHEDLFIRGEVFSIMPPRDETHAEALKRVSELGIYMIKSYGSTNAKVLLVSHGRLGRQLIQNLVSHAVEHPANAQVWKLQGVKVPFELLAPQPVVI